MKSTIIIFRPAGHRQSAGKSASSFAPGRGEALGPGELLGFALGGDPAFEEHASARLVLLDCFPFALIADGRHALGFAVEGRAIDHPGRRQFVPAHQTRPLEWGLSPGPNRRRSTSDIGPPAAAAALGEWDWRPAGGKPKEQSNAGLVAVAATAVPAPAAAAAAAATGPRPIFPRLGLVDRQRPAAQLRAVEGLDGGVAAVRHFDKPEPAGSPGFAVGHDLGLLHGAVRPNAASRSAAEASNDRLPT